MNERDQHLRNLIAEDFSFLKLLLVGEPELPHDDQLGLQFVSGPLRDSEKLTKFSLVESAAALRDVARN